MIYLTVEQANRLLESAMQDHSAQIYPFTLIALETSMRMMEILSIHRENVDVHRKLIYIPKAKSGDRQQPITSNLADFLTSYMASLPEGCPWLFPSARSKSGHTIDIRKSYRRVVRAAGLNCKEVVRHTLRHTAITHLVQVPEEGIEPSWTQGPGDFESPASTSFTTPASGKGLIGLTISPPPALVKDPGTDAVGSHSLTRRRNPEHSSDGTSWKKLDKIGTSECKFPLLLTRRS